MNKGYIEILLPEHPFARSNGTILEHRYIAEQMLGRLLKPDEVVHHKDNNKTNNHMDNLMVFKSDSDHNAFHKGRNIHLEGDVWVAEDKAIKKDGKQNKYNICPICQKEYKSYKANMCLICRKKHNKEISSKPSKNILSDLLLKYSMIEIGKMFNVSDNAVRKWCKSYQLPYKYKDIVRFRKLLESW